MKQVKWALAPGAIALGIALPLAAQDAAVGDSAEIIVVGDSGTETPLSADSLRDAAQAFARNRKTFAPDAQLYLWLRSEAPDARFFLRDRDRNPADDVLLDKTGADRFALPAGLLVSGRWQLRVRGTRSVPKLQPLVLSPGSTFTDRRFGDVRLQCRVSIAFARMSFAVRALAGAIGPCASKRVALFMAAPRQIARATIDRPARDLALSKNLSAVRVPLHDEAIGNEARLSLTYR